MNTTSLCLDGTVWYVASRVKLLPNIARLACLILQPTTKTNELLYAESYRVLTFPLKVSI